MAYKYSFDKFDKESMGRSSGSNITISLKKSVETARFLRGKKVSTAIHLLEGIIDQKTAVPFVRYGTEMAHRRGKGIAAGGFPVKVAQEFLRLVKSAQKNAVEQEVSGDLYLLGVSARQGNKRHHTGRNPGKMKSTNVEIVVGVKEVAKK